MKISPTVLIFFYVHLCVINLHIWCGQAVLIDELLCEPRSIAPTIAIHGEVIVTALFDGHAGENCTVPLAEGLQQTAASVWAISMANNLNIIPGVKIGLLSSVRVANFVRPMLDALGVDTFELGVLQNLESSDIRLAEAAANFLRALNRTQVAIFANSGTVLHAFTSAATQNEICVTWEEVLTSQKKYQELGLDKLPNNGTILIFAPWTVIKTYISEYNISQHNWMIVPTDIAWQTFIEEEEFKNLEDGTLVLMPSEGNALRLHEALQNETWLTETVALDQLELPEIFLHQASLAVSTAVARLRQALAADCGTAEEGLCPELKPIAQHRTWSPEEVNSLMDEFSSSRQTSRTLQSSEPLMRLGRASNVGSEKFEAVASLQQLVNQELKIYMNENMNVGGVVPLCNMCECLNAASRSSLWHLIHWRRQVWVATITSIATVGTLYAIAIALFITVRICKGDVLEGNPVHSFVLLLAVVMAYVAVLPYCVTGPWVVCALQEMGTALGHALLLGTMLARTIMLVTTDDQGFMSHMNGYLQATLWFFIIGVQVALSTQQWLLNAYNMVNDHVQKLGSENAVTCSSEFLMFLLLLSYDMLLLVLLFFTSPLAIRSKRNYREGVCFFAATLLYIITWLIWLVTYILVPPEWRVPVVASGLVAGASTILVAVFIPRTYFMVSSLARARLASAIPCTTAAMQSSSILDINYRTSHQALYDSVNALGSCNASAQLLDQVPQSGRPHLNTGIANLNYYSDHPVASGSAASTVVAIGRCHAHGYDTNILPGGSTSRDRLSPSPENTYERYDSPPSPHKVTRF